MAQFVNVLFSYGTLYYVYRSVSKLNVSSKIVKIAVLLVTFMPVLLCFSGVLLREAWCEFFITLSAFFMIAWYHKGGSSRLFGAFASVLLAMIMHAGCVGVLIGYMLAVFKGRRDGVKGCTFESVFSIIMIVMIVGVAMTSSSLFLDKFSGVMDSDESYLDKDLSFNQGGSSYLMWLEGKSTMVGLLFAPLRMFYLLFSPVPWEWRNLMDIIVFMVDSLIYIMLIINILPPTPTYPSQPEHRSSTTVDAQYLSLHSKIRRCFVYSILFTTLIFSLGTSNSGTAIRHRAKIIPIVCVAYVVSTKLKDVAKHRRGP